MSFRTPFLPCICIEITKWLNSIDGDYLVSFSITLLPLIAHPYHLASLLSIAHPENPSSLE
jgi:hypothetical protein